AEELKRQLQKMGGTAASAPSSESDQEFPSIRQLPLLGVRWVDLYREVKIQETVFELLTQQYEMAKIEEAKEIPVVKVLDAADIPEKSSFPSRPLMIVIGTLFATMLAAALIIGNALWEQVDAHSPAKQLALEAWDGARVRLEQGQASSSWSRWL